jgi:hypothetical protein
VRTERHTGKIHEGSSISCEDRSLRGQSSRGDHEVMSASRAPLATYGHEQLRVGLGHADVVVNDGNGGEDVVEKCRPGIPRFALGQVNAHS